MGLHLHPVDIIFNPIVDTDYTGGFGGLEFVPATRVAYNLNDKWAVAAEEYADVRAAAPLRYRCTTSSTRSGPSWITTRKFLNIETGVGIGVTAGADKLTFKLMLSRDLNSRSQH